MRVMCISQKMAKNGMYTIPFGETVTVVGESPVYTDSWYIAEYPVSKDGIKCSYKKIHFIPLSNIDEMELVNERELQEA